MADGGSEEPSPSSESAPSPMGGDTASPSHTARGKGECAPHQSVRNEEGVFLEAPRYLAFTFHMARANCKVLRWRFLFQWRFCWNPLEMHRSWRNVSGRWTLRNSSPGSLASSANTSTANLENHWWVTCQYWGTFQLSVTKVSARKTLRI